MCIYIWSVFIVCVHIYIYIIVVTRCADTAELSTDTVISSGVRPRPMIRAQCCGLGQRAADDRTETLVLQHGRMSNAKLNPIPAPHPYIQLGVLPWRRRQTDPHLSCTWLSFASLQIFGLKVTFCWFPRESSGTCVEGDG